MDRLELFIVKKSMGSSVYIKAQKPGVFTPSLIKKIRHLQEDIIENYLHNPWEGQKFLFWHLQKSHSQIETGLDISAIHNLIKNNEFKKICDYIDDVTQVLFLNYINLGLPIISCSIVDRPLFGVAQDFFFLNNVSFIFNQEHSHQQAPVIPLTTTDIDNNGCVPKSLYTENHYFSVRSFCTQKMADKLKDISCKDFDHKDIDNFKEIFEAQKTQFINEVLTLNASSYGTECLSSIVFKRDNQS